MGKNRIHKVRASVLASMLESGEYRNATLDDLMRSDVDIYTDPKTGKSVVEWVVKR